MPTVKDKAEDTLLLVGSSPHIHAPGDISTIMRDVIIALVLMIKAFLAMFGKRIFKCFGLGAILMLVCAGVVALGGLAFLAGVDGTLDFGAIVNVLLGSFTNPGGLVGGYGLLILLVLPLLVLILSMFARKKIPYSIFDTYGE